MLTESRELPAMIGSYRVVKELGAGGTGRVYLGQHPVIGSKVAIKVLLPEIARNQGTVERFIQEAQASSQIDCPYIPRYFDFGTTAAGLPYAVMEYFEGETLADRLARVRTLSVAETAHILEQVASALLMAHDAGLVHRDLKPENIFLLRPDLKAERTTAERSQSGSVVLPPSVSVKVLDFGIAKVVGNRTASQTQAGYFLGTPFYCAPEQVFGHPVDARTDVYGLGSTAFEMLTGEPPFTGEVADILATKATEDPPELQRDGVPAAVAQTIRRMLAREPAARAPSMAWVLEELARWRDPEAETASSTMDLPVAVAESGARSAQSQRLPLRTPSGRRTVRAPLIAGSVLAVAVAVVLVSAWWSTRLPDATGGAPAAVPASKPAPVVSPVAPVRAPAAAASEAGAALPAAGAASAASAPAPSAAAASADSAGSASGATAAPAEAAALPAVKSADRPSRDGRPVKAPAAHVVRSSVHRSGERPVVDKPAAQPKKTNDRTDVLIVDPFSHSN